MGSNQVDRQLVEEARDVYFAENTFCVRLEHRSQLSMEWPVGRNPEFKKEVIIVIPGDGRNIYTGTAI